MADELNENSEYGKKKKNEEEPILVAQRYLNIFHQIHIFNQSRRDQFNQMLLGLKPEIRVLLSTLPGGSLLQEYIEELELKQGLTDEEALQHNAEKRKQEASKLLSKNNNKSSSSADGSVIGLGPSFATTLAASLGKALQQAEQRHHEEIQALTQSIAQSQAGMLSMIREVLGTRRDSFLNEAAALNPQVQEQKNKTPEKNKTPLEKNSKKHKKFLDKLSHIPLKTTAEKAEPATEPTIEPTVENEPKPVAEIFENPVAEVVADPVTELLAEPVLPKPETEENIALTTPPAPKSDTLKPGVHSVLSPEIEKIKQALTAEDQKEETFSLDDLDLKPVSLDDELEPTLQTYEEQQAPLTESEEESLDKTDDDWEWEYVEEGSENDTESDDDWEWAYVEENASDDNFSNDPQK